MLLTLPVPIPLHTVDDRNPALYLKDPNLWELRYIPYYGITWYVQYIPYYGLVLIMVYSILWSIPYYGIFLIMGNAGFIPSTVVYNRALGPEDSAPLNHLPSRPNTETPVLWGSTLREGL